MSPSAYFVAHEGYGGAGGSYKESKSGMAWYDKQVNRMAEIFSLETGIPVDEIKSHYATESDWYIDSDKAYELGIIID